MPINKDGTNITAVRYTPIGDTQKTITQVIYVDTGGTQTAVFGAQVSPPTILPDPIRSYNQVTISAQNTYDIGVTIYMTVNGVTKSAAATAYQTNGDIVAFNFTGLTSDVTYSISAYSAATEHANSASTTSSVTTTYEITSTPEATSIVMTHYNVSFKVINKDTSAANIEAWVTTLANAKIGDSVFFNNIAGSGTSSYSLSIGGLSANTSYYLRVKAQATDGQIISGNGVYTILASDVPTTASPGYTFVSSTYNSIKFKLSNNESNASAKIYYRVGATGSWTQYGGSDYVLPSESYTDDITVTTDGNGTALTASTTYPIYRYALVPNWHPSTPVSTNALTTALSTMNKPVVTQNSVTTSSVTADIYNNNNFVVRAYSNVDGGAYTDLGDVGNYVTIQKAYGGFGEGTSHTVKAYFTKTGYTTTDTGQITMTTNVTPTTSTPYNLSVIDSTGTTLKIRFYTGTLYETGVYRYNLSGQTASNIAYNSGSAGHIDFWISGVSPGEYNLNIWAKRDGYNESGSAYFNCLNCIAGVTGEDSGLGRMLIKYRSNPYYVQGIYTSYDGNWNTVKSGASLGNDAISSGGTNVYVRGKYIYFQLRCRSAKNAGGDGDYSGQVSVTLANPVYTE